MTQPTFSPPPELGLKDATLQPLERLQVPQSQEGLGLSGAPALSQVVSSLLAAPHTAERVVPHTGRAAELSQALGDLRWWSRHPGIFVIDSELETRLHGGQSHRLPEGELIIDARTELTWLRLQGRGVDAVWQLDAGGATLHLVDRGASPKTRPLSPELPSPEALTGGLPIAAWLLEEFHTLAQAPSCVARVAAVGMVGRLWRPERPGRLSLESLLELPLPGPAGRAWMQNLPQELREDILAEAVATASLLAASLSSLEDAILGDAADARERARAWIQERDRLESVRFVFGGQDAPAALQRALGGLDHQAALHHSLWSLMPAWENDPQLREVSARDVEAWWGQLSGT